MEFIESLMKDTYTLVYVDYRDNLDDSFDVIEKCMERHSSIPLIDKIDEWYGEMESHNIREILKEIKDDCIMEGFEEKDVEGFLDKNHDEIMDLIYIRNGSDTIRELLKNSDNIPVRVEMLSNYDCINSHWLESQGGYIYPGSYFGDMIDALNLNPAKIRRMLTEKGIRVYGRYPDRKSRDGRELVTYEDFYTELVNSSCGANLLTFIGKVNLRDLCESGFSITEVTIPKDNCCGIFSSMYGGGSMMDMKLQKDVSIKLGCDGFSGYRLVLDDPHKKYECSIRQVYGVNDSFFGGKVKLTAA